jgi:uncharacterized protein YggE
MRDRILTAAVLLVLATTVYAQAPAAPPVVVTHGEATLKRAPDRAWLTVAAETRDVRAAEARRRNAEAMTAVQAALKGAGVRPDALRTTGFSLTPEFDWNDGKSVFRGYVVRNQIEVRVDELDRLSDVLDAVNGPRNVALSIHGPRFGLKDETAARNEALKSAVEDAMSRAQALAAGAKRTLGPIVRVEEHIVGTMPPQPMPVAMRMSAAPAEAATPVSPGEIEVRGRVTLTVEIR